MLYNTEKKILAETEGLPCTVEFVFLLPSVVWCNNMEKIFDYGGNTTGANDLVVFDLDLVVLEEASLKTHLKTLNVTDHDILVFCINPDYFPKKHKDSKYVRYTLIRKSKR